METKKGSILIVDDNKSLLNAIELLLFPVFENIKTVANPNLIPGLISAGNYDIVLLDMNFISGASSGNEGLFWLKEILKLDPEIIVILITAYGDVELAVRTMKEGLFL